MDDKTIIQHYWDRDERAITETDEKYGSYCCYIANNILSNREDSQECVNDTYLKTWNAIPPQRPRVLPAFLGRIVRNLALNMYEKNNAAKRGGGQAALVLHELEECIPDKAINIENDENELSEVIDSFLDLLSSRNRKIFVLRYWYTESVRSISERMKMSENSVSATLKRLRKKLRKHLAERGIEP
ncbi:MAG: sigma-70 family RNA polymerase sigma factor [Ruminococcus sp.]|nr:sigma-70 family RNA polymerase sigma factor [Ruminococcus sp.]